MSDHTKSTLIICAITIVVLFAAIGATWTAVRVLQAVGAL